LKIETKKNLFQPNKRTLGVVGTKRIKVIVIVGIVLLLQLTAFLSCIEVAEGAVIDSEMRNIDSSRPLNVVVTGILDTEFTVSWVTVENISGYVVYGINQNNLNLTAYDDRDKEPFGLIIDDTHHVRIGDEYAIDTPETALIPNTTYYFKIISNNTTNNITYGTDNGIAVIGGKAWVVKTHLDPGPPTVHFIHGTVFEQDGETWARGCLVYCTVTNITSNITSSPISCLSTDPPKYKSKYGFNISQLRYKNGSVFPYRTGDTLTIFAHGANSGTGLITYYVLIWIHTHFQPAIDVYLHKNQESNISIVSPSSGGDTANTSYTIKWNDFDEDDNAMISLYFDMDNNTGGETLIAANISEDDDTNAYTFNTTEIANETSFYIKAVIWDGFNLPVEVYSKGAVYIDRVPPAPISDLEAKPGIENGEVVLTWSATGNDGYTGRAEKYVIKYSSYQIDESSWDSAIVVQNDIVPKEPSEMEIFTLSNITPGEMFYFAIKVSDGASLSQISNIVNSKSQLDLGPPAAIFNLKAITGLDTGEVILTWTATGDDNYTGTANAYKIRYSASPLYEGNWDAAIEVNGTPKPQAVGSQENFTVTGLTPEKRFFFTIKAVDEALNPSNISNVVSAVAKLDRTAPRAIIDLEAKFGAKNGEVTLKWTAPGDDVSIGKARGYVIRYSISLITEDNWDSAMSVENINTPKAVGEIENFTVTGLMPGQEYYFGMKSYDETPNLSPISNIVCTKAYSNATEIVISSLKDGDVFLENSIIYFDALNTTDADNNLTFFWASDIDGTIRNTSQCNAKLSVGSHKITLWVVTDKGDVSSCTLNITVVGLSGQVDSGIAGLFSSIKDNGILFSLLISIIVILIINILLYSYIKIKKR
jgi:hypothetical protein